MKRTLSIFSTGLLLFLLFSCTSQEERRKEYIENTPAYEQFHTIFKEEPSAEDIGKLMDAILDQYHMEHTEKNKQRLGSVFYDLRTKSAIGITEMQLMKYVYQNYNPKEDFVLCASKAAVVLEYTK
jgi:hypothetical protein